MAADGSVIIEILGDAKGFQSVLKGSVTSIAGVVAAISGLAVASAKVGVEFESAFAGVRKTVDATDEQLVALRDGILDLSTVMPQSAAAIASVAEAAGQLGIETDSILDFTETMVQLGDATNLTAEDSATNLARFANITGMPQTEFDRLGSTIVALGNNMATTEAEIVEMSMRIAGAGAQVGMTEEQIMAFSSALSSVGIGAEAGGTAFSTLISEIALAAQTGDEKLEQFASVAGLSASEFATAFEENASGAVLTFIDGLAKINESGGSAIATLDEMGLSDIRMRDALLRAAGGVGIFTEALDISADAWEENTALANEAEQRYATTESQLSMLKNTVTNLGIAVYDGLREPMIDAIDTASGLVNQLSSAFEAGGLTGLVGALGNVLAQVATNIAEQAPAMIDAAVNMIQSFISGIQANLPQLTTSALSIVSSLAKGVITVLPQLADTGTQMILQLAQSIIDGLPGMVPAAVHTISSLVENLTGNLNQIIDAGIQMIVALGEGLIEALPDLIEEVPKIVSNIANVINNNAPKLLAAAAKLIFQLGVGLIKNIPTLIANIPQIIQAVIDVWSAFNWLSLGKNAITGLVDGVKKMISPVKTAGKNILDSIVNALSSLPTNLTTIAQNGIASLASGIRGLLSTVTGAMSTIFSGIINSIKSLPSKMLPIGKEIVSGIAQGIKNGAAAAINAIADLASSLVSKAKRVLGIASPSKVMAKEVGPFIPQGVKVGVENEMPYVEKSVTDQMARLTDKVRATVEAEAINISMGLATGPNKEHHPSEPTNNSGLVINVYVENTGAGTTEQAKNVGKEIGAQTAREIRRRGIANV